MKIKEKGKEKNVGRRLRRILKAVAVILLLALLVTGIFVLFRKHKKERLISERGEVQIVVLGDSIWDICRDETGIAAVLEQELVSARVINCAIMGTSAAIRSNQEGETQEETDEWNRKSLIGLLKSEEREKLLAQQAGVEELSLEEADYIVIAYGLNDYFCAVPRQTQDAYDICSYSGALRTAVRMLREDYPKARICILSQTYCQGYSYGKVDSESDYKDYGGGNGPEYVAAAEAAARELGCIFVNNYEEMGINIHNGPKYLSDATHLTAYGREKYAKILAACLLEDYEKDLKQD